MADKPKLFIEGADADVYVALRVADVMTLRPDWDANGAEAFLRVCGDRLAHQMLVAGTSELARLIRMAEDLAADEGATDA